MDDRDSVPLLWATVFETLRFTCVGAFGLPHVASVDTTVCGYLIPKGTHVCIPNQELEILLFLHCLQKDTPSLIIEVQ